MKVYSLLFFALWTLLTGHTAQQCFLNPYLKERASYPVTPLFFLQTKINTSEWGYENIRGKCGKEWDVYGLCCHPWEIESHLNVDQGRLLNTSQKFIQFYSKLNSSLSTVFVALKKLALASPHQWFPDWATNINFAKSFLSKGENLYNFESYSTYGNDVLTSVYKTEMQKCWSDMVALRRASICSTCSGRSSVFFKDGKGMVADSFCQRSIKSCLKSLTMTFDMIKMLKWLSDINAQLAPHSIRMGVEGWFNTDKVKLAYNEIISDQYHSSIESLATTQDRNLAIHVCDKYFNLAKMPFITKLSYDLYPENVNTQVRLDWSAQEPINQAITKITNEMSAYETSLAKILADYKATTGLRMLQLDTSNSLQIFSSDALFLTASNSVSIVNECVSVTSNIGTNLMNLTLAFP